ncbi:MAG: TIGR04076 family protein [Promethearchaeota archaeon]
MVKSKITVLKQSINEDFAKKFTKEKVDLDPRNTEGQKCISIDGEKSENFCSFAWRDIYNYCFALIFDGNFSMWMKEPRSVIICCTDGIKPDFYKIERIEE